MSARNERLFFLLQVAAHRLKTRADATLLETGALTTSQAAMTAIVIAEGKISQRKVADQLKQRESAIGAMAVRLLKAGYITRERSESDRRTWILRPTPEGKRAHDAIGQAFAEINALLEEAFPGDAMEQTADGLRALIARLDTDEQGE